MIITVFQVFTLSSSPPAVKMLNPPHNQYRTAIKYKNPKMLDIYCCITLSAEPWVTIHWLLTVPALIAAFTLLIANN